MGLKIYRGFRMRMRLKGPEGLEPESVLVGSRLLFNIYLKFYAFQLPT